MRKFFLYPAFMLASVIALKAQTDSTKTDRRPVKSTFESATLIDQQTVMSPFAKRLEFVVQHRFGTVKNGAEDYFGIYAPSIIRLGLNFGITDKLMAGIGSTNTKLEELSWKYAIIKQSRDGSIPLTLSYFGNFVYDRRDKSSFGRADKYKAMHRFSYFTQVLVARKLNDRVSIQVAPSMAWYNATDSLRTNLNFGVSASGRCKVTGKMAITGEYTYPFNFEDKDMYPNLALGIEIGTATHSFQIFAANYDGIVAQRNLVYGSNKISKGDYLIGLNIAVRF